MNRETARSNSITLRFPRDLEREYQQYYAARNVGYARIAFLSGIFLYAVFAHLDYVLAPAAYRSLWLIRLGIVTPVLLAFLAFTFSGKFRQRMHPALALICVFVAASVDVINVLGFEYTGRAYYFGVIITNMYLCTFGRVQWAWAAPAAVINAAVYGASLLFVDEVGAALLMTSGYYIGSTLLLGMVACYTMDHLSRSEFLHSRDMSRLNEELQRHSSTDSLTGLLNRRSALQRLADEAARSVRDRRAYSIAIADVDFFKRINDQWGHGCGDTVLRALAAFIRQGLRVTDVAARWGGEEFLLLFPATRIAGARIAAEHMRRYIEDAVIEHDNNRIRVSITIGVVEVSPGEHVSDALRRADSALYEGKRAGRNRTVIGEPARLANDSSARVNQ